jgi:hypothetical protein
LPNSILSKDASRSIAAGAKSDEGLSRPVLGTGGKIVETDFAGRGWPVAFRGQTQNHIISRKRPNKSLSVEGIGEVSLVPSLWRGMRNSPGSFHSFCPPDTFDWSRVLYQAFDLKEIEARHEAMARIGTEPRTGRGATCC